MKIITIVGARPQFVKAAVVSRAIKKYRKDINEVIIHTGQHYDFNMSEVFFNELGIPKPDYHLGIGGGTHGRNTGRMLESIEAVLMCEKPDLLVVYGDTDSTLAGSLAAVKLHIPVVHIEAGLRSFNRHMPEEINRILTDHMSSLLFTPTSVATNNLALENIKGEAVKQVGDVMFDATLYYKNYSKHPPSLSIEGDFILSTIHRAENTDNPDNLSSIIDALNEIALTVPVVLPIHPRTNKILADKKYDTSNLILLEPIGYLEMIWLLEQCNFVITDSGGLQKEAYFFNKPCITTRNETEWVELVALGFNYLAGSHKDKILNQADKLHKKTSTINGGKYLYGDGFAGKKIVEAL